MDAVQKPTVDAVPSSPDLEAANVLLQHLLEGREETPGKIFSQELQQAVALLAAESRRHSLSGLWHGASDAKFYDEVCNEKGERRPAYAEVMAVMDKVARLKKDQHRIDEFSVESVKGFFGDNRLYHIPRMLSGEDHDTLLSGIKQRAQALRQLVLDLNKARGKKWQLNKISCVQGKALPEHVLRRVAARAAVQWTHNLVDTPELADTLYWSNWYGPDIVRGPDGGWYVLEDNLGYVGGFGDLSLARQVLLGQTKRAHGFPELADALGPNRTEEFYDELAKHYGRCCAAEERSVILYYNRGIRDDNEDRRVLELFKRRGVQPVELPGDGGPKPNHPRLEVRDNRVFLITPERKRASRVEGQEQKEEEGGRVSRSPAPPPRSKSPAPNERGVARRLDLEKDAGKRSKSPAPNEKRSKSPACKRAEEKQAEEPAKKQQRTQSPAKEVVKALACPSPQAVDEDELAKEEPVGMVILLCEACDIQPGHESGALRSAIAEARSRIDDYELRAEKEFQKASRAEKTVFSVSETVAFMDTSNESSKLKMRDGELIWCNGNEKGEEVIGPLSWNRTTCKLSGGDWVVKPDAKSRKELEKVWELSDLPLQSYLDTEQAKKIKTLVESVGQLVGKRTNGRAKQELYKLLRTDNPDAWNKLMKGKRGIPGLLEAYYAGKVKIANGPGFELIEDKELCQYVEHLIRFYLNEEPILKTVPTKSFARPEGGGDKDMLRLVFDDPGSQRNCVIKRVDGRGGDGVWVGSKISREKFLAARPLVAAEPEAFIVQRYTCLSQVQGHLVDIRGPSFFCISDGELNGGDGVCVSPVLWGRGVPSEGSTGKVNISEAGFEFAVGVERAYRAFIAN